jgi:hypothetical protein
MNLNMLLGLFVFAIICFVVAVIIGTIEKNKRRKYEDVEKNRLISIIESAITESGLEIDSWGVIKEDCVKNPLKYTENVVHRINRLITFTLKYQNILDKDNLNKLIEGEYFIGMTEEMLLESFGQPDKIEDEVMKTKIKRTYVYGNKNSGDILVFENNKLVRFKDR